MQRREILVKPLLDLKFEGRKIIIKKNSKKWSCVHLMLLKLASKVKETTEKHIKCLHTSLTTASPECFVLVFDSASRSFASAASIKSSGDFQPRPSADGQQKGPGRGPSAFWEAHLHLTPCKPTASS